MSYGGIDADRFGLLRIATHVVGSMIGAGIFYLSHTFTTAAGPFGAAVARRIGAGGMFTLARAFHIARSSEARAPIRREGSR